jgi:hypothetical protein
MPVFEHEVVYVGGSSFEAQSDRALQAHRLRRHDFTEWCGRPDKLQAAGLKEAPAAAAVVDAELAPPTYADANSSLDST